MTIAVYKYEVTHQKGILVITNRETKSFCPQAFCLFEAGFADLTGQQVQSVRAESVRLQCTLRESILKLGLISEERLLQAATQCDDRLLVNLDSLAIDQEIDHQALVAIGAQVATHYHIIPIKLVDQTLTIATCDPFAAQLFDPSRPWPQASLTITNEQTTYHLFINGQTIEYNNEN